MVFHESVWKSTNLNVYNRRNYTLGGTVIPWRTAGKHAHPFPFFCIYPPVNQQASEQIFPSDLKYCLPGYSPQRDNEKKHLLTYFEVGFFFQATIWRTRRDGDRKRCHLSAWTPRGTRALVAERAPCVQPVSSEGGGTSAWVSLSPDPDLPVWWVESPEASSRLLLVFLLPTQERAVSWV